MNIGCQILVMEDYVLIIVLMGKTAVSWIKIE